MRSSEQVISTIISVAKEDKRISPTYSVSNIAASDFGLYYASKAYEALIELAQPLKKNGYGKYLLEIAKESEQYEIY